MTKEEIRKRLMIQLDVDFPSMEYGFKSRLLNKLFEDYKDKEEQFMLKSNLHNYVKAFIRHEYTHYEELLRYGLNKSQCRYIIKGKVEQIYNALKKSRKKEKKAELKPPKWRQNKKWK